MSIKRLAYSYDESDDESFESLADFFTLISIALIFAAIVFGISKKQQTPTMDLPLQEVVESAGSANSFYEELFYIIVTRDDVEDVIYFIESGKGRRESKVTNSTIEAVLDGEISAMRDAKEITLILDRRGEMTTLALFTQVQDWLSTNGMGDKLGVGFWN